jgi:hypothetical protein
MKSVEEIDEWFFDKMDNDDKIPFPYNILAYMWFIPCNVIGKWHYRIFVRGIYAIKGCNISYSCGGYLPDDVCEWDCKRCRIEGINQVEYADEIFYSDSKLHNLKEALRGH